MVEHAKPIDISGSPDLMHLAEEVHRSREPRVLQRDSEDLVLVVPLPRAKKGRQLGRERTEADIEAFQSAAGAWKGLVDTDKLIEDSYESRRISPRPPVEL